MSLKTVYQTLKFKDNNDEVLVHGPYDCDKSNAWLHNGYYFWEEFLDPAHHWGKTWCKGKYIITRGECLILPDQLFDLVGNLSQLREMRETVEYLHKEGLVNENTTVAHVIDFMKKEGVFDYLATRANTTDSFRKNYQLNELQYDVDKDTVLIMNPAVQICIYNLEQVLFSNFEIVFQSVEQRSA
jgi:hypothetical protein